MLTRSYKLLIVAVLVITAGAACTKSEAQKAQPGTAANVAQTTPAPQATPSKSITAADIAKLKWIEGTWRGMDGEKPFFERYRIENDTAMVVETLTDATLAKVEDTSRFELKDGEFGNTVGDRRSAASSITADSVQFVPAVGGGNNFRFERQAGGTWRAVLEWPAKGDKPAGQKIYIMEPYSKPK